MGPRIDSDKEKKSDIGVKVPGETENAKLRFAPVERLSKLAAA